MTHSFDMLCLTKFKLFFWFLFDSASWAQHVMAGANELASAGVAWSVWENLTDLTLMSPMRLLWPLTAMCLVILLDYRERLKLPRHLLLFFSLAPLPCLRCWWVWARHLFFDVSHVEVWNCASQVNLSLTEFILVWLNKLKLPLAHPLLKVLSLTHSNNEVQIFKHLDLITFSQCYRHNINFFDSNTFSQWWVFLFLGVQVLGTKLNERDYVLHKSAISTSHLVNLPFVMKVLDVKAVVLELTRANVATWALQAMSQLPKFVPVKTV